jgi:DNA-binding NtrC family response regulator
MNLLILADEFEVYSLIEKYLISKGFKIYYSSKEDDFYSLIREKEIKIILLDLREQETKDFSLLRLIKNYDPLLEIIIIGNKIPASKIIEALKVGASDYLVKPLEIRKLYSILRNIQEKTQLRRSTHQLEKQLVQKYIFEGMVGKNPLMLEIFSLIERVSKYPVSVLITGETGTGKEMVARAIHNLSPRRGKKFIVCDCTSIPETLFESELFGYLKGAFTGADKSKDGLFKEADEGTIFLDEIAEIPIAVQSKLLRVLEEQQFRPLGSTKNVKVDVRIICATSRDLREDIKKGNFREDLFHRINIVEIKLPPLRERKEDIPLLCSYFLEKSNKKFGKQILGISRRAKKILLNYPWPGNVRELENTIERAVMLCQEKFIDIKDLPDSLKNYGEDYISESLYPFLNLTLEELEKRHILAILKRTNNNKQKTAKLLGLSRQALYRKLKKYNIPY